MECQFQSYPIEIRGLIQDFGNNFKKPWELESEMREKYPHLFTYVDSGDRILLRGEGCNIREFY